MFKSEKTFSKKPSLSSYYYSVHEYDSNYINKPFNDDSIVIHVDGGCTGNVVGKDFPAGWGVVVLDIRKGEREADAKVLHLLYGPVELRKDHTDYIGAEHTSNNTAELTALAEAMKWLLKSEFPRYPVNVVFRFDSEYAVYSMIGKFNGAKNVEIILRTRALFNEVSKLKVDEVTSKFIVSFSKVKGHSGNKWNDRADELATLGKNGLRGFLEVPDAEKPSKRFLPSSPPICDGSLPSPAPPNSIVADARTSAGEIKSPRRRKSVPVDRELVPSIVDLASPVNPWSTSSSSSSSSSSSLPTLSATEQGDGGLKPSKRLRSPIKGVQQGSSARKSRMKSPPKATKAVQEVIVIDD